MSADEPRLYKAKELAALTGETRAAILRKAKRGDIPSVKFGRSVLFRLEDVLQDRRPARRHPTTGRASGGWEAELLEMVAPKRRPRTKRAATG